MGVWPPKFLMSFIMTISCPLPQLILPPPFANNNQLSLGNSPLSPSQAGSLGGISVPVSFSAKSLVSRVGLRWLRQYGNNPHPWPRGFAERWDYNPVEDHETGDIRSLGLLHVIRDLVPYTG